MGALLLAPLALLATPSADVEIRGGEAWRAESLEVSAQSALTDSPLSWRGELEGDALRYRVTADGGVEFGAGLISLRGFDRSGFERAVAATVRGIEAPQEAATQTGPATAPAPNLALITALFIAAALFLASPLFLFMPAIVGRPLVALRQRRSIRLTLFAWSLLALALALIAREGAAPPLIYGCGGAAWGLFVAANARIVFPAFSGLGLTRHGDVFRILGAWLWICALRTLRRAAFYAPFFALLWLGARAANVPDLFFYVVVVPGWGLLIWLWHLSLVENATFALDMKLVTGAADDSNPWHIALAGYFRGYVNRLGWSEGEELARDVLFLPGAGEEVTVYGGGLTRSRIVVGIELLEFGLAPYGRPHDYEAPREHKLFWSDWHAGLVVPLAAGEPATDRSALAVGHHVEPATDEPVINLGQPPTLAGFVEPSALDTRLTHRPAEDPTWLEWDPGSDYDGTDAGDHDFLFGLLVWKLGLVERHADQRQTLLYYLARLGRRRALRVLSAPYRALFERPQVELEDAFAAVNLARHHLTQYLAWQTWRDDAFVTSRAPAPELERQSAAIYDHLAADESPAGGGPRAPRRRMRYLATFGDKEEVKRPTARRLRRLLAALAIAAALGGAVAINVIRAINYHPRYLEKRAAEAATESEQGPAKR